MRVHDPQTGKSFCRKRRQRFDETGQACELTFSCYRRFAFLSRDRTRAWFVEELEAARQKWSFDLWAYVLMPEHVHLLINPKSPAANVGRIAGQIKEAVARKAIAYLRTNAPLWLPRITVQEGDRLRHRFWQPGGGYDRNAIEIAAVHGMIQYLHANPVRRGLVACAEQWEWSSADGTPESGPYQSKLTTPLPTDMRRWTDEYAASRRDYMTVGDFLCLHQGRGGICGDSTTPFVPQGVPPARVAALLVFALLLGRPVQAADNGGYEESAAVTAAGRLDWTFALGTQSLAEVPADWTPDYQSTAQRYARFVPPSYYARQAYPLILFISAAKGPAGWKEWEPICRREGLLFAAPHEAGNECPLRRRVRIVLDVLDDVCRKYHVDPDRIYLGGISGGARVACTVAFALPEYFGGLVPVCAGGEVRAQRWLWQRATDRLSTAFITGENDFNRAEVERYWTPILQSAEIRTRTWVVPKMGHAVPGPDTLGEAFAWLEADLPRRREGARRWPAQRINPARPLERGAWSEALLSEGRQRLEQDKLQFSGLMQLKGVLNRWPDLPAAHEAKKILTQYAQAQRASLGQDRPGPAAAVPHRGGPGRRRLRRRPAAAALRRPTRQIPPAGPGKMARRSGAPARRRLAA